MTDTDETPQVPELKIWLIVRKDIAMSRGKLAGQSGHAHFRLALQVKESHPDLVATYLAMNEPKITVGVKNLAGLQRCHRECAAAGLPHHLVEDEGRTEFDGPTLTVLAVGPCYRSDLPKYVEGLQMIKDKEA